MNTTLDSLFNSLGCSDEAQRRDIVSLLRRAGIPEETPQEKPASVTPQLVMLDPARIKADPATYQFRSGGDAITGVTHHNRYAADRWDPILHGDPLLVHERRDGTLFVADGHHRLELANRLNAQGQGPGLLAAQVLREADGYTPRDVKIIAAYKNIAHGQTDMLDTARVFREAHAGDVHQALLPSLQMDKGNLRVSYSLSRLPDKAFSRVANGEVPAHMAAEVINRVPDAPRQDAVMDILSKKLSFTQKLDSARAKNGDSLVSR